LVDFYDVCPFLEALGNKKELRVITINRENQATYYCLQEKKKCYGG